MKFLDHHVHNGYSRCVKEPFSVEDALKKGLRTGMVRAVGITNHVHFNSPDQDHLATSRELIDEANEKLDQPMLLLGAEVDIDQISGKFVMNKKSIDLVDYIIAGPHNMPHRSLAFPDLEQDEIDEYFGILRDILVTSLCKNPIDIWVHPFLQEIEIGGEVFSDEIFEILLEVLPILRENDIAMEISSTFYRDKNNTVKITKKGIKAPPWLQIARITAKIYQQALEYGGINFSFASDAHGLPLVGDIGLPIMVSRMLKIPSKCIVKPEKFTIHQ